MESSKGIKLTMCNLIVFESLSNTTTATENICILFIQYHLTLQPNMEGLKKEERA